MAEETIDMVDLPLCEANTSTIDNQVCCSTNPKHNELVDGPLCEANTSTIDSRVCCSINPKHNDLIDFETLCKSMAALTVLPFSYMTPEESSEVSKCPGFKVMMLASNLMLNYKRLLKRVKKQEVNSQEILSDNKMLSDMVKKLKETINMNKNDSSVVTYRELEIESTDDNSSLQLQRKEIEMSELTKQLELQNIEIRRLKEQLENNDHTDHPYAVKLTSRSVITKHNYLTRLSRCFYCKKHQTFIA